MPEEARFVIPDLQRIGKYDILERIADGGFATLYRGHDPFLKRLVAIKVCVSADPELRQQFLREAEIGGNLDHPSIVRTFDFGFDQVGPYLVQEYLQGEDLSRLIERRAPIPPRRKIDLLIQIAEGLAYSHAQRVLHLDVKPGNVRVLGLRQAKILDFGIARLAETSDSAPGLGGMVGTAGYLPPEQVMGKAVDARADIFGFGALAYEWLTFCRPFTGGTIPELLQRVLAAEAEPMTRYWPDCGDRLANVIGRCLRRDPASRYPSFEALIPDLVAVRDSLPEAVEHEPVVQRVEGRRSRRTLVASAVAAGVLATATVAFIVVPSREPASAVVAAPATVSVPRAAGPAPGALLVTAAPWGEVVRLYGPDGEPEDLPENRMTPLRLWVVPGTHRAEIVLSGGETVTCSAEVVSGEAHLCHVEMPDTATATDYWKEVGWWP